MRTRLRPPRGGPGSHGASPGRDRLPTEVWVLTAIAFTVAVGFGIVAPVIPLYAQSFGVGAAAAGAVVSVFALMRLVSSLGGGRLVDLLGERKVLASGVAIVAVSSLLAGLAQSYLQLLLLRGAGGVGSAMFTVSAFALMYRVVASHQRGRAAGLIQSGFLFGGITGPAIGGALAEVSLRAPFFVYAGGLGVATAIAIVALPDPGQGSTEPPAPQAGTTNEDEPPHPIRAALADRAYQAALVANFGTGWAFFGVRSSLLPLFVADALGREARWVGIGFVVSAVTQALLLWPAGRVTDMVGRRPAILGGSLVATVALALLALWPSLPGFLVSMAVYGAAAAFLGTAPAAAVGDVVGTRSGTVVAVFQMAGDLGAICGPLVAGWLAQEVSFESAFWVTAAMVLLGALMALRMPETRALRAPDVHQADATT